MSKPRKLSSGNWTIPVYDYKDENGKRHFRSFTAPSKAEVELLAAQFKAERDSGERKTKPDMTVRRAVEKYIELSESLSPTTLSNYEHMLKYGFKDLLDLPVKKLTKEIVQVEINKEAKRTSTTSGKRLSPKTVKNEYGLISSALSSICDIHFDIKLPKIQQHVKDIPEPADVLNAIKGSSIELPCLLAMWLSFSRSEILGLRCSSIKNGYITISQVQVQVDGVPTIKQNAKVDTRLRRHKVPKHIMALIKALDNYQEYLKTGKDSKLIQLTTGQLQGRWKRLSTQHNLNLTFHGLRHMNASIMAMLNIPEKYAMERGGWRTPHVMKSVYQHTFNDERKKVDQTIDDYFNKLIEQ